MKLFISLFLVFFSFVMQAQIPKSLHGFWQFQVDKPGDWNGFHIGKNYVELFYQIYAVKSIDDRGNELLITLDNKTTPIFLTVLNHKDGKGKFKFNVRQDTISAMKFDSDPDIDLVELESVDLLKNNWRLSAEGYPRLSVSNNSISLGDEVWSVEWIGKYKLNNEYRALVHRNGDYKMFYISPYANQLKLVYDFKPNFYAQESTFGVVYDFIGNWYNPDNNKWKYGFFEEFALIDGQVYPYQQIKKNKNQYSLTLKNLENNKTLKLNLKTSPNQITIGKEQFMKVNKFLPAYKGEDKTAFYDSKFEKIDTAIIRGYLRNNTSKDPFSIGVYNWINDKSENFYGDIDDDGFFQVKVPLLNTSQAFVDWRRAGIVDIITPGETYFLYKDLASGETLFLGGNERLHNEIARYAAYTDENNIRPKTQDAWRKQDNYERSLKDTTFLNLKLAQLDSLRKIDVDYMNKSNLSSRSEYFINKQTEYKTASSLMQKKFQLDYQSQEKFSDEYMQVVKQNFFDKNVKPISLIRDNHTFLRDYIDYTMDQKRAENIVYHSSIMNRLIENDILHVDKELKEYAKLADLRDREELGLNDLKNYDLILNNKMLTEEYGELMKESSDKIEQFVQYELFIENPSKIYKGFLPHDLADLFITKSILTKYKASPQALDNDVLWPTIDLVDSEFFKSLILKQNNEFVEIAKGKLQYPEHLRNTDHLKESKDADAIIAEILAPHKGKVVYVDFWGTWCGPCVAEMAHAPAAKKAMENKDVVFIYLANRTPQTAWENFIKVKDLEGPNVYHYNLPAEQQSMVERRLVINGFPTYMLFNKKGELVNNQAPRPSNLTGLTAAVDKLLEQE